MSTINTKKILIVDDDHEILTLLSDVLKQQSYEVTCAEDAKTLLAILADNANFDMLLLDVMLPDGDGIQLCQSISQQHPHLLILLMTANQSETDRVLGLELGADDYIQKPFNIRELQARIKAFFRRATDNQQHTTHGRRKAPVFHFANWQLDTGTRVLLSPDNIDVPITSGLYEILVTFLEHPQRVLSRDFLLDLTKRRAAEPFDRTIDVQVSRLRQKLNDDPNNPQLLKTIRNGGYMLATTVKQH